MGRDERFPGLWRTLVIPLVLLLGACGQLTQTRKIEPSAERAKTITALELARRLKLSVTETSARHVKLENASNRIYLFVGLKSRPFVNGEKVGPFGEVTRLGREYRIPETFEAPIRRVLRKQVERSDSGISDEVVILPEGLFDEYRVVIDPGHGGKDPGAISILGFYEKTVNLDIGLEVARLLKLEGFQVKVTRATDRYIELEDRARGANHYKADLFVSIHADSYGDRTVGGFTLYVAKGASAASREAARCLEEAMRSSGIKSRGVRKADYKVLVKTSCPAVLVEVGFLSNPEEARKLKDPAFRKTLARILAAGIVRFATADVVTS